MNVKGSDESSDSCPHMGLDTKGFLVGWLGARLAILVMYAIALNSNRNVIPQFGFELFVSVILFIIGCGMFTPGANRALFFKIALPVEYVLATPILGSRLRPHFAKLIGINPKNNIYYIIPLNISVYQRRLCMFVMMVLGEGVIQILDPTIDDEHIIRCYAYATCGLVLLFCFAMLYCDAVLREHLDHHALRRSAFSGMIWVYMHGPLAFFMYLVGISIKLAYHDVVKDHQIHKQPDVVLGVACGAVVLCLAVMRSRHKGSSTLLVPSKTPAERAKKRNRIFNYALRLFIVLVHWLAAYRSSHLESSEVDARDRYLYLHCVLTFSSVALEVIFSHLSGTKDEDADYTHDEDISNDRDTISGCICNDVVPIGGRASRLGSVNVESDSNMSPMSGINDL